ncbi:diacylglycerol/lipid kinase family protein, partial [Bacteroidota bacterium]
VNMIKNEWLVIVNPNAGKGLGKKDWSEISAILKQNNINFDFIFTEKNGHATEISKEMVSLGFKKIIVVGGDGTFNEAVNGILKQEQKDVLDITLGMIPVGTGNDWCKTFQIPRDYAQAVGIIKKCKTFIQDVGKAEFTHDNKQKSRYFVNIAGIGFDAYVALKANKDKERNRTGTVLYMKNLIVSLITYQSVSYSIIFDNGTIDNKIFSLSVGKGKFNGGGMKQLPFAEPDDGFLDFTVIEDVSKPEVIRNLKKLYNGTHITHPKISTYKTKKLEITTNEPVYLEVDGESVGTSPFTFEVIPKSLKVICGF